jgi:hypothetical protein
MFCVGHLALFRERGRARVGSGMIDVLNNEPLTFILSPLKGGEAPEDGTFVVTRLEISIDT